MRLRSRITKNKWHRISEILGNLGILFLGSTLIPAIFELNNIAPLNLFYGLILSSSCIMLSILLERD